MLLIFASSFFEIEIKGNYRKWNGECSVVEEDKKY